MKTIELVHIVVNVIAAGYLAPGHLGINVLRYGTHMP